jgi:hypothetical protein
MDLFEKSGGVEEKVFLKSEVHIGMIVIINIITTPSAARLYNLA